MIKGHTKLAPDRFFGVLKSYGHTSLSTLDEIVNVVRKSMIAVQNIPQLTKTAQRRLVNWYDWKSFLSKYFQHIPAITGYHHFCFDQNFPGCVFVQVVADSPEQKVKILSVEASSEELPTVFTPDGINLKRKFLLFSFFKIDEN